jgi:hypothetical protein
VRRTDFEVPGFADEAERDACLAPYKKFDILKSDSQSFSVTLSPMYSGYIGYGVGALRIRLNAALSGIHPHFQVQQGLLLFKEYCHQRGI